jgi:hypothetical protein
MVETMEIMEKGRNGMDANECVACGLPSGRPRARIGMRVLAGMYRVRR